VGRGSRCLIMFHFTQIPLGHHLCLPMGHSQMCWHCWPPSPVAPPLHQPSWTGSTWEHSLHTCGLRDRLCLIWVPFLCHSLRWHFKTVRHPAFGPAACSLTDTAMSSTCLERLARSSNVLTFLRSQGWMDGCWMDGGLVLLIPSSYRTA
jgi:hypothetical protein